MYEVCTYINYPVHGPNRQQATMSLEQATMSLEQATTRTTRTPKGVTGEAKKMGNFPRRLCGLCERVVLACVMGQPPVLKWPLKEISVDRTPSSREGSK